MNMQKLSCKKLRGALVAVAISFTGGFIWGMSSETEAAINGVATEYVVESKVSSTENDYHEMSTGITADDYLGVWNSGKCIVVIKEEARSGYSAHIRWASNAATGGVWNYHCTYDSHSAILVCNGGGVHAEYSPGQDDLIFDKKYNDGSCTFSLREGVLTWHDNKTNREVSFRR